MSPCDNDLFAEVKEPVRGTQYNTRDKFIRAIGRSILNINKDGRAEKFGKNVVNNGGNYIEDT